MTLAEGIAETLVQHHVRLVTAVPGHGATQVYEAWRIQHEEPPPFSYHEEVAAGMAHGAALRGRRAAVLLKAHGFLKAANAIADSLAAGTTAGLVYVVFNDPTGAHSDSVLDIEGAARELGLPLVRPEGSAACSALAAALHQSEDQGLPHLVILPAANVEDEAPPPPEGVEADPPAYERDVARHVCCPLFAPYQHAVFEARREGREPDAVPRPALPRVPDELPDEYRPMAERYVPAFEALANIPRSTTTGDTTVGTLFALPPYEAVDLCTYMGGSLPLALGALATGDASAWAVTGDFGFVSAGHLGLLEAQQRALPLNVLLLHNGRAEATGRQPVPAPAVDTVLAGHTQHVVPIADATDPEACRDALRTAAARDEYAIVHANYTGA
ncbi:MAG: thiamine pyrophosphate-dependent enzyme [Salinivenus sp.]